MKITSHKLETKLQMNIAARWWVFSKERFPVLDHGVMLFFLTLGNTSLACILMGKPLSVELFLAALSLTLMFFFRLRCFDEIKDYDTDCKVNPTRPLARGLLRITDVKIMFICLTIFEICLVFQFGLGVLITHCLAIAYSYLMYKEFFIGKYLAPLLTTYGLTHTIASSLLFFSVASVVSGVAIYDFPLEILLFSLLSWGAFNLFEFARKTYAKEEERENVPTYTTTFGITGGVLLSLSQVACIASIPLILGYGLMEPTPLFREMWMLWFYAITFVPLLAGLFFIATKSVLAARCFRVTCSAYMLSIFILFSYIGVTQGEIVFAMVG